MSLLPVNNESVSVIGAEFSMVGNVVTVLDETAHGGDSAENFAENLGDAISSYSAGENNTIIKALAAAMLPEVIKLRDERFSALAAAMGTHDPRPQKSKPAKFIVDIGYGGSAVDRSDVIRAAIEARRKDATSLPAADARMSDGEVLSLICASYMAARGAESANQPTV